VVDDKGLSTADRVVKLRLSVASRSRDAFIFPRTTHQVGCIVVEGREHAVAIFVGVNTTPVGVTCRFRQAPVIEAVNRQVMERAFSFNIAGDPSLLNNCPRADSAVDFFQCVIDIVGVVLCLASQIPQILLEPCKT